MATDLSFFGICLFVWESNRLRILLPNATSPSGATHPDKTKPNVANVHMPRLYLEGPNSTVAVNLNGHRVTIDGGAGKPTRGGVVEMIGIGQFAENIELRTNATAGRPSLVAGEVIVTGGTLSTRRSAPQATYRFNQSLRSHNYELTAPSCSLLWSHSGTVTISVHADPKDPNGDQYILAQGPYRVVIGNVCNNPMPATWECEEVSFPPGSNVPDEDFKWLYHMFKPAGTRRWSDLLKGKELPVPEAIVAPAAAVASISGEASMGTTSSCFPGEWCPPNGPCP